MNDLRFNPWSNPVCCRGWMILAIALGLCSANAQNGLGDIRIPPIAYTSVWAELYPNTLKASPNGATPPPMFLEFYEAAKSPRLRTAKRRWQQFESKYGPVDGGFEDAAQERLWKWAELELKRCSYLLDKDEARAKGMGIALRNYAAEQDGG
ncbi:MAG: hypothetical protein AAGH89_11955 [Verrucomicrobiota bacterium]